MGDTITHQTIKRKESLSHSYINVLSTMVQRKEGVPLYSKTKSEGVVEEFEISFQLPGKGTALCLMVLFQHNKDRKRKG